NNQLLIFVPSSLLAVGNAGAVSVTVVQSSGQGTVTSNTALFTITPLSSAFPVITSVNPTAAQEGSNGFNLTVSGSGFVPGATVQWTQNGVTTTLTPISNSSNQLVVAVPSSLVAVGTAGTASITVVQPNGQTTVTSNTATFFITRTSTTLTAT